MHKTGTSTLGTALQMLGYRWTGWNPEISVIFRQGNVDALLDLMEFYDCCEDGPWYLMYEKLYERFGDVKFILTTRKSDEIWYNSLVKHKARSFHKGLYSLRPIIYGTENIEDCKDHVIATHRKHNEDVKAFAQQNGIPFLEVCWENGDGWSELCEFLGKPKPEKSFPHKNSAPAKNFKTKVKSRLRRMLS